MADNNNNENPTGTGFRAINDKNNGAQGDGANRQRRKRSTAAGNDAQTISKRPCAPCVEKMTTAPGMNCIDIGKRNACKRCKIGKVRCFRPTDAVEDELKELLEAKAAYEANKSEENGVIVMTKARPLFRKMDALSAGTPRRGSKTKDMTEPAPGTPTKGGRGEERRALWREESIETDEENDFGGGMGFQDDYGEEEDGEEEEEEPEMAATDLFLDTRAVSARAAGPVDVKVVEAAPAGKEMKELVQTSTWVMRNSNTTVNLLEVSA